MCVNLINMVELEVLEEQQQQSRDGLDNDLLVTVHINAELHALKDGDAGKTRARTVRIPHPAAQLN